MPVTVRIRIARILALVLTPTLWVVAQSESELLIYRKVLLPPQLEDVVAYGGPKETYCDGNGNIIVPAQRKYTSATNSVVRIAPDAQSSVKYAIDNLPELRDGDIIDFAAEVNSHIYLLARQVLQYSDLEVPQKFGHVFVVHFSPEGSVLEQTRLAAETQEFEPTGIAVLQNNEYLIVGRRRDQGLLQVVGQIFRPDGTLRAKLDLGGKGTRPSRSGRVLSPRVVRPAAIKTNHTIYVVRGTSAEPIYILSELGELQRAVLLKGPYIEFDSPHISNEKLIVEKHAPLVNESFEIRPARRMDFPVFDLRTGEAVYTYYWHQETVGLSCYAGEVLTFVGPDPTSPEGRWAILYTRASSVRVARLLLQ
jgi:hypothetical protein